MFDQVKPEVVLHKIGGFIVHQSRDASHCGCCQTMKAGCSRESSRSEIGGPVHSRRLNARVGAFPRVVLLEYVSGIRVRREGLRHSNPATKYARPWLLSLQCRPASGPLLCGLGTVRATRPFWATDRDNRRARACPGRPATGGQRCRLGSSNPWLTHQPKIWSLLAVSPLTSLLKVVPR